MPWYDGNIPAKWESALDRKTGARISVQVVFDPDGEALALNGNHDVIGINEISQGREFDIDAEARAVVQDVGVVFNDPDNYFNPSNSLSPFHQAAGVLDRDHVAGATSLKLRPWEGFEFRVDEVLSVADGNKVEQVVVASWTADSGATGYHELIIDSPGLVHDFGEGAVVFTKPFVGKEILISLVNQTESTGEKISEFLGYVTKNPELEIGRATVTISDKVKKQLDSWLVGADSGDDLKLMCIGQDGTLQNSIHWGNEFNIPPLSFTISDGALPPGLVLDSKTGAITGTPTTAGVYSFTIQVSNAEGDSKTQACSLRIYNYINTEFDAAYGLSTDYEKKYDLDWSWQLTEPSIVNGALVLGVNNRDADRICWHPDTIDPYYQAYTFKSPGTLSGSWVMVARINAASMPSLPQLYCGIGVVFSNAFGYVVGFNRLKTRVGCYDPQAVNSLGQALGVGSDLVFRIRKVITTYYFDYRTPTGSWVNLASKTNAQGVVAIGAFFVTDDYTVTTAITGSVSYDYMRVYIGSLAIDTTQLPKTRVGDAYNFQLMASGGAGEYVWDVSVGSLPAGLSLDQDTGVISGTPTAEGTTNFTIRVTDGAGATATQAVSIDSSGENELLPDIWDSGQCATEYDEAARVYVGGGLDREQVMVGAMCPIGVWKFRWTTPNQFEVVPPGLSVQQGDIAQDFAMPGIIEIPAAAWAPGMAADDEMTFITGISWANENPVQIVHDIYLRYGGLLAKQIHASSFFGDVELGVVNEHGVDGAVKIGVSIPALIKTGETLTLAQGENSDDIVVAAGNVLAGSFPPEISLELAATAEDYTGYLAMWKQRGDVDLDFTFDAEWEYCRAIGLNISITFDRAMTIAQAVGAICTHAIMMQCHDLGVEYVHCFRPRSQATTKELTNAEVKQNPMVGTIEPVNEIIVKYAYDYIAQEYQKTIEFPGSDGANFSFAKYGKRVEQTIYCPGIYSDDLAMAMAKRLYEIYSDGARVSTIDLDFRGLFFRLGEQVDIDTSDPDLESRFEIISKSVKVMGSRNVALMGWDVAGMNKFALAGEAKAGVNCAW